MHNIVDLRGRLQVVIPTKVGIHTHNSLAKKLSYGHVRPVFMGPGLRRGDEFWPMRR